MEFHIIVPSEQEVGTFSNLLTAWFSAHEFTLDFCVTLPPAQEDDDSAAVVPCPVVSRLKIPVTVIFTMLQAMNGIMTRYEDRFGPITRIGEKRPAMKPLAVALPIEYWISPIVPAGVTYAPSTLRGSYSYIVRPELPKKRPAA